MNLKNKLINELNSITNDYKQDNMKTDDLIDKKTTKDKCISNTKEILNKIDKEIQIFPFKDKINISTNEVGLKQFNFRFENGDVSKFIIIDNNKFEAKFTIHNIYRHYKIKSNNLFNKLNYILDYTDGCIDRHKAEEKNIYDDPIKNRYNLIVRKIKLINEQIIKLKEDDPRRAASMNELNNFKNIADKLKAQITQ